MKGVGADLAEKENTYRPVYDALNGFAAQLPVDGTTNARVVGRLMNNIKLGYYPTDPDNISLILRGIQFPEGGGLAQCLRQPLPCILQIVVIIPGGGKIGISVPLHPGPAQYHSLGEESGPNGAKKQFLNTGRTFLRALGKDLGLRDAEAFSVSRWTTGVGFLTSYSASTTSSAGAVSRVHQERRLDASRNRNRPRFFCLRLMISSADAEARSNPGGIAVSGDCSLIGMWQTNGLYVQLSQPCCDRERVLLYRTVRHSKDLLKIERTGSGRFLPPVRPQLSSGLVFLLSFQVDHRQPCPMITSPPSAWW